MGLLDQWNKNKFSIYKSEEKTVLKLLESLGKWLEEVIKGLEGKTDLYGDHKGTWQGISRPTLSDEGLRGTVEKHINDIKNLEETIKIVNEKLELNIKDFGAKGDGVTDDTQAFEEAFAYLKTIQTNAQFSKGAILKVPYGVYIITHGFEIDVNVGIVGEGQIKPPSYKLFGANAYLQDMAPNCTTIKYNEPKTDMTMFKPVFGEYEAQYHKDFYMENIMLDGADGVVISQISPSAKGVKDVLINFTGRKSNGVDMSNVRFMRGSNNLFVTGFSGYGLKTHHWQQHNNSIVTLCGTGIITGGDGGIMSPYVAFCKTGIQIGDTDLVGATDRIQDVRIEWAEEYGIKVINGGNNRINGFIDRCGFSGYAQINDTWNMNVDLTLQRCGCVWRGGIKSDLSTNELKMQGSNAYISNARGGNYRFTHIRGGSRDTAESDNYKAPVIATSLIGGIDFVTVDNTQGFSGNLFEDYYLDSNSRHTIIANDCIHNSKGIKTDKDTNKLYIDLFDQYRFRPPTNWGKPSDTVGVSGDLMFDSQNNVLYYKNATTWKAL